MTTTSYNELTWHERAPLLSPRAGYIAGVVGGRYVIAGGSFWQHNQKEWTSRLDEYDPLSNTWTEGTSLPEPRSDAAGVAFGHDLYLFGGGDHVRVRTDVLVLRHGKWETVPEAALPEPRLYAGAVVLGRAIYVLGGMSRAGDYMSARNTLWKWSPQSPRKGWEILPPFPGPGLINSAITAVDEKIYLFGGGTTDGMTVVNSNAALEFDCRTKRWTRLPDLPIGRRCWWAVPLHGKVLLIGGFTTTYEKEVLEYHLVAHSLRGAGALPYGVCDAKFFRIGKSVVGAGGEVADKIRGAWTFEAQLPAIDK